jgi:Tfp pilus assembly protein PilO
VEIKNRQKVLLIAAVACMSLLLGNWLLLDPLLASWKSRSERIDQLRQQVTQGAVLIDRERTIRDRWEGMRTNTLPANTSLAEQEFIKTFDRCAHDSGITIASYRPQWKQIGDDYSTYECRADLSGNIENLSRFLYELEKDPLSLKVESMEIATHDDKGQQLTLGIQISSLLLTPTSQP